MEIYKTAAIGVATVLAVDALIHLYWLTGRTWPAADSGRLSSAVLNADVPFTPRVLVRLAMVLTTGAITVLMRADLIGFGLPAWIPVAGTLAVVAGTLLRGGAGIVWALGIGASRDTAFYWLNLSAYTPLCFVLCGGALVVLNHG